MPKGVEMENKENGKYKNLRILTEDWEMLRELSESSLVSMTKMLHYVMPIAMEEFGLKKRRGGKNGREEK